MSHWLTTHYPHPLPDDLPWHVYLKEQFRDIGEMIKPGDSVLFYELGRWRPRKGEPPRKPGRQGIVSMATISGPMRERPPSEARAEYIDDTTANWLWEIPARAYDADGFVYKKDVFDVLEYKATYTMHGFGMRGSGVKLLETEQHERLVALFRSGSKR